MGHTMASTTTGFVVLGVHLSILFLLLLTLIQYHRRRKLQPIRSRLYWQGEGTAVVVLLTSTFGTCAIEINPRSYCRVYTGYGILIFTSMMCLVVRAAHVFSAFELSKVAVQAQAARKDPPNHGLFVKYSAYLQSSKFQAAIVIGSFLVQGAIWGVVTFVIDPGRPCNEFGVYGVVSVVTALVITVPTLYIAKNIAMLKDGLLIKKELVMVGIVGLATIGPFTLVWILTGSPFWSILISLASCYATILIQIGMPLYMSYVWERYKHAYVFEEYSPKSSRATLASSEPIVGTSSSSGLSPRDLERLLRDPNVFPSFLEYCRLQLNHENPLFYKDAMSVIKQVKENSEFLETQEFSDMAHSLFATYMAPKATLQINLSWKQHQRIKRACFRDEHGKFNAKEAYKAITEARVEIFRLMYDDVFPRYFASAFDVDML